MIWWKHPTFQKSGRQKKKKKKKKKGSCDSDTTLKE